MPHTIQQSKQSISTNGVDKAFHLWTHSDFNSISKLLNTLKHQSSSFNSKSDILCSIVSTPIQPPTNLQQPHLKQQSKTYHIFNLYIKKQTYKTHLLGTGSCNTVQTNKWVFVKIKSFTLPTHKTPKKKKKQVT